MSKGDQKKDFKDFLMGVRQDVISALNLNFCLNSDGHKCYLKKILIDLNNKIKFYDEMIYQDRLEILEGEKNAT